MKLLWILILLLIAACGNNKYYSKSKEYFDNYYCIKQKRDDNLRLLIFTEGIPHYSYTKIYADENNEVTKIVIERDGSEFYQAVTDFKNNVYYFQNYPVISIDTIGPKSGATKVEPRYAKTIQKLFNEKYCTELKFPLIVGFVRVERPKDYLQHLGHRNFLKQVRNGQK